ncbi:MAG: alpha/beta hydrolase [Chlamydiales bacterium]|nr:alpha/beta hydrolase [Chlamydiales bacterium]
MKTLITLRGHHVSYVGIEDDNPLPAIFYFALSGMDSLSLDPFNQPVEIWKQYKVRVFSMTLPGHDESLTTDVAITKWIEQFKQGQDPFTPFFHHVSETIDDLHAMGLINEKTAIAGLSRGAFIAAHVAAINKHITHILGFSPLTTLRFLMENDKNVNLSHFDLLHLSSKLYRLTHRYYIGNRDTRVSTKECCYYIMQLANEMHENNIRALPVELFIKPSIGRHGHGTSKEIFEEGAHWLAKEICCATL